MLKIIKSYLDNRYEYVELEQKCSKIKQSLPRSIIQGSKLSGTLYTIYTKLQHYYHLNKLKINPEKTSILVVAKKTKRERNDNIRIITPGEEEDFIPKKSIKSSGIDIKLED